MKSKQESFQTNFETVANYQKHKLELSLIDHTHTSYAMFTFLLY